jgi:DNA polymerase sigma
VFTKIKDIERIPENYTADYL